MNLTPLDVFTQALDNPESIIRLSFPSQAEAKVFQRRCHSYRHRLRKQSPSGLDSIYDGVYFSLDGNDLLVQEFRVTSSIEPSPLRGAS